MPIQIRDRRVAPYRVLAALEGVVAGLFGVVALLLTAKFVLELYWAQQKRRPADDLAGNLLLVGLLLFLVASVFTLGAVSLARGWKGRWALQGIIALTSLTLAWFVAR